MSECAAGLQKRITEFRGNGDPVKWVANDSVKELGLTTSVRKVLKKEKTHTASRNEVRKQAGNTEEKTGNK